MKENAVVECGRQPAASQNNPFCALLSNQMFIVIDVPIRRLRVRIAPGDSTTYRDRYPPGGPTSRAFTTPCIAFPCTVLWSTAAGRPPQDRAA
jgi:hypothetical protein